MAKVTKKSKNLQEMSVQIEVIGGETFTIRAEQFPQEMQNELLLHGMLQKFGDAAGGSPDLSAHDRSTNLAAQIKSVEGGVFASRAVGGVRLGYLPEALVAVISEQNNGDLSQLQAVTEGRPGDTLEEQLRDYLSDEEGGKDRVAGLKKQDAIMIKMNELERADLLKKQGDAETAKVVI